MKNSKIAWTDHTMNFWIGCTKVSDGCKHCYAEAQDLRFRPDNSRWGVKANRVRTSDANWNKAYQWDKEAKKSGLTTRVFAMSLGDFFDDHPSILPEWRTDAWKVIRDTPHLTWLLLTKRPENIEKMLPEDFISWGGYWEQRETDWNYPNVVMGVTCENQKMAEERLPLLLVQEFPMRFISCEPLLSPIDLHKAGMNGSVKLDQIIVGAESGHNARPMDLEWARSLRDQCKEAGVPFFMKQICDRHGRPILFEEFPTDLQIREYPK